MDECRAVQRSTARGAQMRRTQHVRQTALTAAALHNHAQGSAGMVQSWLQKTRQDAFCRTPQKRRRIEEDSLIEQVGERPHRDKRRKPRVRSVGDEQADVARSDATLPSLQEDEEEVSAPGPPADYKVYEKRGRHRTKEGRYDTSRTKQRARRNHAQERGETSDKRKRGRVLVSAKELMDRYHPEAVHRERLTVRQPVVKEG
jgi:hypothetical protein